MNKCAFCQYSVPSDSTKTIVPIFYCDHQDIGRVEMCEEAIENMMNYNKIRSSDMQHVYVHKDYEPEGGF